MKTAALLLSLIVVSTFVAVEAVNKVTICHHPGALEDPFGQKPITKTIPVSALPAHLAHGDTIGPCASTPTPRPTAKPTPKPTPRATPRPTPKPTPRPTRSPPAPTSRPTSSPPDRPTAPPTDS